MKRLALMLLWAGGALGQTRISWQQLQPGGQTQPRPAWQRGLAGPRVSVKQVPNYLTTVIAEKIGPDARILRIVAPVACTITPKPYFSGLIQAVWYSGRVGILAGHTAGATYRTTLEHVDIEGPCIPVETTAGKYPKGIHAFLAFASVGQPTGGAPLRVLVTPFMPTGYSMDRTGLVEVTGPSGQATFVP